MSTEQKAIPVSMEAKSLPYYKFYEREMATIPKEKLQIGAVPSKISIVPIESKNSFLDGTDTEFCQIGWGTTKDGTGFVCNETFMENVDPIMMDWWFGWHCIGSPLRYRIWDKEDHYFAMADNPAYVLDPNVPLAQKTWGVNHYIVEDIGFGPSPLTIRFKRPADLGYNERTIGTEACAGMVAAICEGALDGIMTHKWRSHKNSTMLNSRFWLGYTLKDGNIVKTVSSKECVPRDVAKNLFLHNIKEFSNLAAILPEVYLENKHNF